MEEFINDDALIENDYYNAFKDSIQCPLCLCILINPVMCMKCQNVYCKKCVDSWAKKDNKCPNRCVEPNYNTSKDKLNILSNLQFTCKYCQKIIKYSEVEEHKDICGIIQTYEIIDFSDNNTKTEDDTSPITPSSSNKMQKISRDEMNELKKQGNDVSYITSKK